MNLQRVSPFTIIYSFIYIAIGLQLRKLTTTNPASFREFVNTGMICAVIGVWLVQLFIYNGNFQNKNRHMFIYGSAVALVFVATVYISFPSLALGLLNRF